MSDSSAIPVRREDDTRQAKVKSKAEPSETAAIPSVSPSGPRKLIRPRLPEGVTKGRRASRVSSIAPHPLTNRWMTVQPSGESSHAEAFYFQKQIQSQTLMVFVLEDGQQIEGHIEWYDRNAIKVRNSGRTLIYKSSIKYLYKAADHTQV
jgi:sRNA-binding regulator protein Hfq